MGAIRLRPLRHKPGWLPGDTLVADYIDGPQRVRARGARNRAENRRIIFRDRRRDPQGAWDEAVRAADERRTAHVQPTEEEILRDLGLDDASVERAMASVLANGETMELARRAVARLALGGSP